MIRTLWALNSSGRVKYSSKASPIRIHFDAVDSPIKSFRAPDLVGAWLRNDTPEFISSLTEPCWGLLPYKELWPKARLGFRGSGTKSTCADRDGPACIKVNLAILIYFSQTNFWLKVRCLWIFLNCLFKMLTHIFPKLSHIFSENFYFDTCFSIFISLNFLI